MGRLLPRADVRSVSFFFTPAGRTHVRVLLDALLESQRGNH